MNYSFSDFRFVIMTSYVRAVASGGLGESPPTPQFLAEQLTLSQPGGQITYAHHSTTRPPPGFSDLVTALYVPTTILISEFD